MKKFPGLPTSFKITGADGRIVIHTVVDAERRDDGGWMVFTRFVDRDGKIREARFKRAPNGDMEPW